MILRTKWRWMPKIKSMWKSGTSTIPSEKCSPTTERDSDKRRSRWKFDSKARIQMKYQSLWTSQSMLLLKIHHPRLLTKSSILMSPIGNLCPATSQKNGIWNKIWDQSPTSNLRGRKWLNKDLEARATLLNPWRKKMNRKIHSWVTFTSKSLLTLSETSLWSKLMTSNLSQYNSSKLSEPLGMDRCIVF